MTELALQVLHIGIAAAWFGHKLLVPSDLASSLGDQAAADALLPRVARAERLGQSPGSERW